MGRADGDADVTGEAEDERGEEEVAVAGVPEEEAAEDDGVEEAEAFDAEAAAVAEALLGIAADDFAGLDDETVLCEGAREAGDSEEDTGEAGAGAVEDGREAMLADEGDSAMSGVSELEGGETEEEL